MNPLVKETKKERKYAAPWVNYRSKSSTPAKSCKKVWWISKKNPSGDVKEFLQDRYGWNVVICFNLGVSSGVQDVDELVELIDFYHEDIVFVDTDYGFTYDAIYMKADKSPEFPSQKGSFVESAYGLIWEPSSLSESEWEDPLVPPVQ